MAGTTANRGYPYPSGSDANDVPYWNQAGFEAVDADVQSVVNRSKVIFGTPLTTSTTAATAETVTPLAVTFTAEAGVTYAITLTTRIQGSSVDLRAGVRLRRGTTTAATQVGEALTIAAVASVGITTEYTCYDTPGAGSVTYTVFTVTLGGTGNTSLSATTTSPSTLAVRAC